MQWPDVGLKGTKLTMSSIFLGCQVRRGTNWRKRDQDGGPGSLGTVVAFKRQDGSGEGLEGLSSKGMRKILPYSAVVKWHKTKLWCFYALGDLELVETADEQQRKGQRRKTAGQVATPGHSGGVGAIRRATYSSCAYHASSRCDGRGKSKWQGARQDESVGSWHHHGGTLRLSVNNTHTRIWVTLERENNVLLGSKLLVLDELG